MFEWQSLLDPKLLPPPSCTDLYLVDEDVMVNCFVSLIISFHIDLDVPYYQYYIFSCSQFVHLLPVIADGPQ